MTLWQLKIRHTFLTESAYCIRYLCCVHTQLRYGKLYNITVFHTNICTFPRFVKLCPVTKLFKYLPKSHHANNKIIQILVVTSFLTFHLITLNNFPVNTRFIHTDNCNCNCYYTVDCKLTVKQSAMPNAAKKNLQIKQQQMPATYTRHRSFKF